MKLFAETSFKFRLIGTVVLLASTLLLLHFIVFKRELNLSKIDEPTSKITEINTPDLINLDSTEGIFNLNKLITSPLIIETKMNINIQDNIKFMDKVIERIEDLTIDSQLLIEEFFDV